MSESEILAAESADAKEAIRRSLDELKASLGQATDFRLWTKKHPWAAVGLAAAGGFAAAAAITPRPDQSVTDKLSTLNEAIHAARTAAPPQEAARVADGPTLYQLLLASIFDLAKLAISNFIRAAMERPTAVPEECDAEPSPAPDQPAVAQV